MKQIIDKILQKSETHGSSATLLDKKKLISSLE
jgi:hypothetical protein